MQVWELMEQLQECSHTAEVVFYINDEHGAEYKRIDFVDPATTERRNVTEKVVLW